MDVFSPFDHRMIKVNDQIPVLACVLDALDVPDGDSWVVVLAVATGKSRCVFVQIACRQGLFHLAEQCGAQTVLPGDRGLHDAALEFLELVNGR